MQLLRTVQSAIWLIFSSFLIFYHYFTRLKAREIIAKYEKRGKFQPILHDKPCDNYFIAILYYILYFVMTTLSIGDPIKIRISSDHGVEKLSLRKDVCCQHNLSLPISSTVLLCRYLQNRVVSCKFLETEKDIT